MNKDWLIAPPLCRSWHLLILSTCQLQLPTFSTPLTIHLDQKFGLDPAGGLVFARGSSSATDGVDLIYEDGRRSVKPGLRKTNSWRQIPSPVKEQRKRWGCVNAVTISNSRRTSFSDSPLYLEVRVEEDTLKKVVLHSVATALANIVFPVPGGPTISTP